MATAHWGENNDTNLELWDELFWVVGQWLCQHRAFANVPSVAKHIENPAAYNSPCDWCYDAAYTVMDEGLQELLQIFGSLAYSYGADGVPEHEAARHALQAMIERAREMERTKELLAQVAGRDGWRKLPLEHDERREARRRLLGDDDAERKPSA